MKSIPDQQLDAFVDDQLDQQDRLEILVAMANSDEIKTRVAESRRLKDLLRLAYPDQRPGANQSPSRPLKYSSQLGAAVLGALAMFFVMQMIKPLASFDTAPGNMELAETAGDIKSRPVSTPTPDQVLFHLSSGDQQLGQELLDQVELVASQYASTGRDLRILVVTNNEGLRHYQVGYSRHTERIHELYARYDNIVFAACGTTLGKYQGAGESAVLLPEVIVVDSGIAEITRRQQQGWKYIRI
jgi:intracellular sulfur oxidation DsrE/DsrF family protein